MDKAFLAKFDEQENTIEKLKPFGTDKYFFEDELQEIEDELQEKFDKETGHSLVIENGSTDYYFSEKISDSLMCWTMPIYYGCKQIHKFLPEGSYINIDINSTNVTKTIKDIIDSNYAEKNIENLKKARTLIMNKYNIWPTIEKAINKETFIL